jgi:diguanylate cyclase (GGDEF)-like protein/PAS domain S-box-containing protein
MPEIPDSSDVADTPQAPEGHKVTEMPEAPRLETFYRAAFESALDALSILDNQGRRIDTNPAASDLFGLSREELLGTSYLTSISTRQQGDAERLWKQALAQGELRGEYQIVRPDGDVRDVVFTVKANILPGYHLAVLHDITGRKRAETAVRRSERQLFQFLEAVPVAIFVLDAEGNPYYSNTAAQQLLGRRLATESTAGELAGVYQAYIAGTEEEYPSKQMPIIRALSGERSEVDDMEIRRPDKTIPLQVSATPIFDENGRLLYAIAAFSDISERRHIETVLRDLSVRDELTGLYNRRYMSRVLKEEQARCERYGHFTSLIMLDVDRFKRINDRFGHQVGDHVLKQVAQLLRDQVRVIDRPVRYGGEELAVISPETTDSGAFVIAERIRRAVAVQRFVARPGAKDFLPVHVTVSVGVACLPSDADSADSLVAAADHALYEAKSQGRNRTVLFGKSALRTNILETTPLPTDQKVPEA